MTNTERMRQIHREFCEGHLLKIAEEALPTITVDAVPFGTVFQGREGLLAFMGTFRNAFPDIRIEYVSTMEAGDRLAVEARWTGTHTGPLATPQGEIPPTGRRVEHGRFAEIIRFENGRLASIANYQDVASLMRELGR